MQLEQQSAGDVVIVRVKGEITSDQGADVRLKDKINSLLHEGHSKLLLDLGGVTFVDSAGLGQLVSVKASTARQGASLKLLHVTRRLHDLLVVTRLVLVFDTFDDEAAALASFAQPTGV